ncbi:hypothetical protein M427DRAFT_344812 [Gonapodya prolifera JEL478]|uniref:CENP-V/GFA domain-containing protein n=1 Tax=Gonapodya prolifera (strain JEL478) TaxID=1344416 RepID=A0A139AVQ0_GONPJ|nr:hypothetical protein M427DRAFT_344812 [Gonapodya prolifera JEL478]|eukprot:KXS20774.1 hypothetical protein M427DRAFT_344812 [Gonapodya prolifera JEL478]
MLISALAMRAFYDTQVDDSKDAFIDKTLLSIVCVAALCITRWCEWKDSKARPSSDFIILCERAPSNYWSPTWQPPRHCCLVLVSTCSPQMASLCSSARREKVVKPGPFNHTSIIVSSWNPNEEDDNPSSDTHYSTSTSPHDVIPVHSHCHCGGVSFFLRPPIPDVDFAPSSFLSMYAMVPENTTKWHAGNCFCDQCRLAVGVVATQWAFVPTAATR